MTVSQRQFRDAMGTFVTGVTIVTTMLDDRPRGITANSFSSVSLDPPLVLFCLGKSSTNFDPFMASTCFAVNILSCRQEDLSTRFAMYEGDRFEGVNWDRWLTGAPILADVVCAADCDLEARHDAGDHVVFIGRARRVEILSELPPLLYHRGGYARLG